MSFKIICGDITEVSTDAIVNAANSHLMMGGGVCGAIFRAAGAEKLQRACDMLAPVETGQAIISPGFDLPADYIIHAVGPVYDKEDKRKSEDLLRRTYISALKVALNNKCKSVAFPLISSGIFAYPKQKALEIAISTIREFLEDEDMEVVLVLFDQATFDAAQAMMKSK